MIQHITILLFKLTRQVLKQYMYMTNTCLKQMRMIV